MLSHSAAAKVKRQKLQNVIFILSTMACGFCSFFNWTVRALFFELFFGGNLWIQLH